MTALVSRDVLLGFVNVLSTDTRYDVLLQALVEGLTSPIEDYIGRKLELTEVTEYFPSNEAHNETSIYEQQIFFLKRLPVDEDETVTIQYSDTNKWGESDALVEGTDFLLDREDGVLRIFVPPRVNYTPPTISTSRYTTHPAGFRVIYSGGYRRKSSTPWSYLDVPKAIETAAAIQASIVFNSTTRGSLGLETVGGDNSDAMKKEFREKRVELSPEVRMYLRPYVARGALAGRRK